MVKHIQILNDENFEDIIESGVTLVDFFADWCGPCRMLTPILEDVSQEMHKQVNFGKLDIDQSFKIAGTFQVTSVPTLILFKNGKEVGRLVGLRDASTIKEFTKSAL
ncbi:MAG: thioredoxin [Simkania negevensis]|nr:thioredoxin [Simkania negevensis]